MPAYCLSCRHRHRVATSFGFRCQMLILLAQVVLAMCLNVKACTKARQVFLLRATAQPFPLQGRPLEHSYAGCKASVACRRFSAVAQLLHFVRMLRATGRPLRNGGLCRALVLHRRYVAGRQAVVGQAGVGAGASFGAGPRCVLLAASPCGTSLPGSLHTAGSCPAAPSSVRSS